MPPVNIASLPFSSSPRDASMRNTFVVCLALILVGGVVGLSPIAGAIDDTPEVPKGFTPLFNGKDLAGWHGMPDFDPYKLDGMGKEEREGQIAKWTEDAHKH